MMTEYDSQRDHQQYDRDDQRRPDQYDQRRPDQHEQQQHDRRQQRQQPDQRRYDQPEQRQYDQRDQRHYDHREQQHYDHREQPQQQRSVALERGRAIKLMRNGDSFFPGRSFVINQRKYPMLDVFLDDASQLLHANFGAVRCIYTPKNGTRLHDISELEDHRTYVAGGGERFKRLQ